MGRDVSRYVDACGARVPSVTEVLALAGFSATFDFVPAKVLERARVRGSDVHEWIDTIEIAGVEGQEPPEHIDQYVQAFLRWRDDYNPECLSAERTVVSLTHRYAGTLDLYARVGGETVVVDFKTSAAKVAAAKVQTAGYRFALAQCAEVDEQDHARNARRAALYLHQDGRYTWDEHKNHREDEADFLSAVRVAHWRLRHGAARIEDK